MLGGKDGGGQGTVVGGVVKEMMECIYVHNTVECYLVHV